MKLEFCRSCGKRITHFAPNEKVVDGYYCACVECEQDFYSFETVAVETKDVMDFSDSNSILATKNCDLDVLDKTLLFNDTPCCIKGGKVCKNLNQFVSEEGMFIQCGLSGNNKKDNIILKKVEKDKK